MSIVDRGSGPPLVLVPGIQGPWEYLRPAVESLSACFRVLTFPLCGERHSGRVLDPALGLDNYTAQISAVLASRGLARAVICGVSFGGLVALRFAAANPAATDALVLASTPGPDYRLSRRHEIYARAPWLCGPLFLAETPWRLRAELRRTFPDAHGRLTFSLAGLRTLIAAPISLPRFAARARLLPAGNRRADCARISAPTLVVIGERELDRVVPVEGSREYARLIRDARLAILEDTGHLGTITRPDAFAALVRDFVRARVTGDRSTLVPGVSKDELAGQACRDEARSAIHGRVA